MSSELNRSVLVVDDEAGMRLALQASFQRDGWSVETASGVSEALNKLEQKRFPLVVTDVCMPDGDGFDVMRSVRSSAPETAVIVLTAFGNVPDAVQAMRGGACDYLTKPISFEQLQGAVKRVMQQTPSLREAKSNRTTIIGSSALLLRSLERARHAARTNADILIEAESGTGKEILARYVHEASARRDKPFVAVNCAALPEHLLESELFGHVKGAFTDAKNDRVGRFEMADRGTLFLDEIANVPLKHQAKLLSAIETGKFERVGSSRTIQVDVRVISATNSDLRAEISAGRFRADLLFRLNTVEIHLPPLRERREDIAALASFFLKQHLQRYRKQLVGFDEPALRALTNHPWPGNIRELNHVVERAVLMARADKVSVVDLGLQEMSNNPPALDEMSLEDVEKLLIQKTLLRFDGNARKAAESLGLSRSAFYRRLEKFNL